MTGRPQRSVRILHLLELAEESPTADDLRDFLADPEPDVRRTALTVLSEAAEGWDEPSAVFAGALLDPDPVVRGTAAELLRELREVLVPTAEFAAALRRAAGHDDPRTRVAAVGSLWRHRLGTTGELTALRADPDPGVRCEAVLGLVARDALDALAEAAGDPAPAVRIAVARGVAAVGDARGAATLVLLAEDPDPLVRAAALTGLAATGCAGRAAALARAGLADPAWQVRQGAALALSAADPAEAVSPLIAATSDTNLDVRKAAVRALAPWLPGHDRIRAALERALADADADVRAFARMALAEAP